MEHTQIIKKLAAKYQNVSPILDFDDLFSIGAMAAMKEEKPGHAYIAARNAIVDELRKHGKPLHQTIQKKIKDGTATDEDKALANTKMIPEEFLGDKLSKEEDVENQVINKIEKEAILAKINEMPKLYKFVFTEYFIKERTQADIANDLNLTSAYMSHIIKRGSKALRGELPFPHEPRQARNHHA